MQSTYFIIFYSICLYVYKYFIYIIKKKSKREKKRIYIPSDVREAIQKEVLQYNDGFHAICETIYYCFIRNTELAKLKVKHVNLSESTIFIPKELSKNKKDEFVTIPNNLKIILAKHIENSLLDYYLFSSNNFKPGEKIMPKKKNYLRWQKLQQKLNFKKEYQFYSLKDTGITNLFLAGLPSLKIKNQARHSSIQITELYLPQNMGCDETIKNAKNKF